MMVRRFLLLVLAAAIFFGCDEKFDCEDFKLGIPFVVKPGHLYQDCPGQLSITMLRVDKDSRCPANANCIWEGNAEVVFVFRNGAEKTEFTMDTNPSMPSSENEIEIFGYSIKLIGLNPYPDTSFKIRQKDYRAEIIISKVISD